MNIDLIKLGGIAIVLATIAIAGIKAWKDQEGCTLALFAALLMTGVIFS
jgi:hypothetical protein